MGFFNEKITRQDTVPVIISSATLVAVWVSHLYQFPGAGTHNPPYHRFGGFDFHEWWIGWAIYGTQMVVAIALIKSRLGYRKVLWITIALLTVCLLTHLYFFLVALGKPAL